MGIIIISFYLFIRTKKYNERVQYIEKKQHNFLFIMRKKSKFKNDFF
jgi:hypothetical protein